MNRYVVMMDGKETRVEVLDDGACIIEGEHVTAGVSHSGQKGVSILLNGESHFFLVSRSGASWEVVVRGVRHLVTVETERQRLFKAYTATPSTVHKEMAIAAPMPAMVVRVAVKRGDTVCAGDGLMVLEAMKMENEIRAQSAGTVKEVCVKTGEVVEKGEILLLLE